MLAREEMERDQRSGQVDLASNAPLRDSEVLLAMLFSKMAVVLTSTFQKTQHRTQYPLEISENRHISIPDSSHWQIISSDPSELPTHQAEGPSTHDSDQVSIRPPRLRRAVASQRHPGRYQDLLPEGPLALSSAAVGLGRASLQTDSNQTANTETGANPPASLSQNQEEVYRTLRNNFSVFREYLQKPLRIPDEDAPLETLSIDPGSLNSNSDKKTLDQKLANTIKPFENMSTYRIGHWFHSCAGKLGRRSLADLINHVIKADDFSADDLPGAQTMEKLNAALDKLDKPEHEAQETGNVPNGAERVSVNGDGWVEESVRIEIPTGVKQPNKSGSTNNQGPPSVPFDVPGSFRRPLVGVIKSAFQSDLARDFHYEPFRLFQARPVSECRGSDEPLLRLHDELYSSDAWITEQQKLDQLPPEPGCNLPKAIAALMFWSDATHVSQFGQSKMWPVYLFFGNLSKWLRCKPHAKACQHVAHIPSLPENFQDFFRSHMGGKSASPETLRHCKRDLFQAVWGRLVQDPEFLEAYRHGVVIKCADGITRRIYPRIFTYSADYPEKVLVATIRDLGECPCPLCLVKLGQIPLLGQASDTCIRTNKARADTSERIANVEIARKIIYTNGYAPGNDRSEVFLKSESLVATENAFSKALREEFDFDYFKMLVVDLMHEFELGVWKAVFTHLVRMLYAVGSNAIAEFNSRFRSIGNFGRATIRSFASMTVTDMKNWAARTFEDCLQCCIPCLEDLFPEPFNTHVLRLIHTLALWHGLAKLRQHTDATLDQLSAATRMLGKELRSFVSEVCPSFDTTETPKERSARDRREAAQTAKSTRTAGATQKGKAKTSSALPKTFSLRTIKIHLLGHYVPTIRWFGTTDSYSTQIGELEHRVVKSYYRRGNKKDYVRLATRMQRRNQHLDRITEDIGRLGVPAGRKSSTIDRKDSTPLPPFSPKEHHQIAHSRKKWVHIGQLVGDNPAEPAFEVCTPGAISTRNRTPDNTVQTQSFIETLKDHILGRLAQRAFDGEEGSFSDEERDHVIIVNNLLYEHSKIRINYTTYNIQRDYDIINPSIPSRSFIMVKTPDTEKTRFWYARVLRIYHLQVVHRSSGVATAQTMEVLWIRWLGEDPEYTGGLTRRRLERVGYVPDGDGAFGFVDPALVIRGAHLIPAFTFGKTLDLLPKSNYWDTEDGDWVNYYVNPFVDRDMLSRFLGTGAGHVALGTQWEADIAGADTIPEPPLPQVLDSDGDKGIEPQSILDGSEEEDDDEEAEEEDEDGDSDGDPVMGSGWNDDAVWEEYDSDGPEEEDPIFEYDYGN
ncbi:hypothetical protein FRB90_005422 [Tulasnella sp. 427]|nr:hypothetical protein FRB90_005422 [Tulasnella sp. 427]